MNAYVLAILGLLGIVIVGAICYGFLFKGFLAENDVKSTPGRLLAAAVGMYLASLVFIYLFRNVSIGSMTGVAKGIDLALLTWLGFMAIPLVIDAPYFKAKKMGVEWALIVNWLLSFVVLGIIVGALA